uniref:Major facilitator superfamily (MFS) profile domain-containing protein n=1 Tax=Lepeophtheirus salmonis TaxID=72036 RepID=A0A0K2T4G0_LEPSM
MDTESSREDVIKKSKNNVLDPEFLMDSVGSWNKYQFFQNFIFCIIVIFFTYSHYLPILYLYVPEHHCLISGGEEWNLTQKDLKAIFIPIIKNESHYEKCIQYDVDVIEILEIGVRETNTSWPTIQCKNGWHYELDNYFNSVASEFDFVCDDSWKGPLTDTVYFIGSALGMLIYGWIGDHLGRYWTIMICNWSVCIFGIGLGFSPNYIVYTIIRFFMGISTVTSLTSFFVLTIEWVSKSKRAFMGNFCIGFATAICGVIMPSLFYALKDWRLVNHAMHAQMLLTFLLPFLIHESVRWLLERRKFTKASDILEKVAKFNGKELDKNIISELKSQESIESEESNKAVRKEVTSILELFKTPRLRRHILTMIVLWYQFILYVYFHSRSISLQYI